MVHRGQAMVLLVVTALTATIVVIVAMSGTGIPAMVLARAGIDTAPASGIPNKITIGATASAVGASPAPSASQLAGTTGPRAGAIGPSGTASTTLVPPNVYTYPPDDHGRDGTSGPSPSPNSGGASGTGGSGGHHG